MKRLTLVGILLSCSLCILECSAQDFGCPMKNGEIHFPKAQSDPTYGTTILSKQDSVQASLQGQVLTVVKSPDNFYTVVVQTDEIIIAYKYMQTALVTKHQQVETGSILGHAQKTDSVGYSLGVSIWYGREGKNASELLPCKNRKLPKKE